MVQLAPLSLWEFSIQTLRRNARRDGAGASVHSGWDRIGAGGKRPCNHPAESRRHPQGLRRTSLPATPNRRRMRHRTEWTADHCCAWRLRSGRFIEPLHLPLWWEVLQSFVRAPAKADLLFGPVDASRPFATCRSRRSDVIDSARLGRQTYE